MAKFRTLLDCLMIRLLFLWLTTLAKRARAKLCDFHKRQKQGIFKKLALKSDLSAFKACGKARNLAVFSSKFFHKFHKSLALL